MNLITTVFGTISGSTHGVYRDTSAAGAFPLLVSMSANAYYSDTGLSTNTTYYYRQRVSRDGWTTLPSAVASARTLP